MTIADSLDYICSRRLAVVATVDADGAPSGALVGVAVTDGCELVFDTLSTSRKHANLLRDPRAAVVFAGPGEQTLQLEGVAHPVSVSGPDDAALRATYYAAWPDGRARLGWADLAYWRISPRWALCGLRQGPIHR